MSWKDIIRKGQKTATRSAELWSMNDYDFYQNVKGYIKSLVKSGAKKNKVITKLSLWLPNAMAHMEGFMNELVEMEPSDSISDVDWEEVAMNFEEDIDTIIEDYFWGDLFGNEIS